MRILALDWGTVRIGAAISDEGQTIAFPLERFIESRNSVAEIKKLIVEQEVGKIIIGAPISLSGKESDSLSQTEMFVEQLKKETKLPIETVDERFSSVHAGKILQDQNISAKDQRLIKDNISAQILLQRYLDTKN